MKCNEAAKKIINDYIYKNRVVIFNDSDNEERIENLFLDKHTPVVINISKFEAIQQCLNEKSGDNILPKVYLNGMYSGHFNEVNRINQRGDFDILFK
jgi:hypothetical protein